MFDYEKLGQFYLGREYDLEARQPTAQKLLYDAKDLTTHAVCVGMTGSGKTGLCLSLLEEAAIDNIPAIVIDPKGDLGNLLLAFPDLAPADYLPWIDPAEATRKGMTVEELAKATAANWRKGLADSDQPPERIARFRDSADIAIYTPGSTAGLSLTVL
ncbi:MAG: helicase HerA domain-containing protein, partial [Planctomycetaceae bacterium]